MKIAFVNDTFLRGRGADSALYEIARRMGKKHEVDIITFKADFPEENFKIKLVPGRKLLTGTWKDFFFFNNLRLLKQFTKGYDIVNLHHFLLSIALWKKNLVVTYNGSPVYKSDGGFRRFMRDWAVLTNKFLLRFVPRIITISYSLKDELKRFGIRQDKIEVIYEGISEEFRPSQKDREFMLFVGRHEPHKRVDELIRLSKDLDFRLKIAGDGPLTSRLKEYAKGIDADKVEFLGRVERKRLIKLYQECSFFVSASKWEGFGLIFLEAAACSKPSIAYRVFSIPEIIQNNKTGFLVDDYTEMKEKAQFLIENKGFRKKIGKSALSFSKKFDWDENVEEYESVFLDIESKIKNKKNYKNDAPRAKARGIMT